jgi:catechol 2,3-dioxygenase-like lactoylglutathione lyase family enzyme
LTGAWPTNSILPTEAAHRRGFFIYDGRAYSIGVRSRLFFARDIDRRLLMLASSKLQTIVWTARIAEAEQFYSGTLGLPLKGRSHGALVYDVGGGDLRVSPVPSTAPSTHTVLGFAVPDLGAIVATLNNRGVKWERFPGFPHDETGVLTTPEGAKVIWLRDPDGNLLSIVQYV